ncbi:unnamed protein product [Hymenolepis diminuta]|uniref:VHS domain-containing protein n=1 Tax=Hymenolepis diminuta TaxID=6216 RepID=A0A564Y6I9_HYMDI|nr:unnamed protein product [Hymenolepis diminuta]
MARYKDIFDSIVYATSIDCPNRLLAFTRVRNIVIHDAPAAHTAPRQIINRFRNTAIENYKMGLWSLDLLQLCTLHGGDNFAPYLNSQDQLNELLEFFLNPEKSKAVSTQIQMKIYSLLKTWAISYKNAFSSNNFEYACDRLKRNNISINIDDLYNSHWLPDKDVFGSPIDSVSYNLQDVFGEISKENKQLHAELQSIFQMASNEKKKGSVLDEGIQKRFKNARQRTDKIKQMVTTSRAFWNDFYEHLVNKPSEFNQIDSNVQKIFESMDQAVNFCEIALQLEEEVGKEIKQEVGGSLNGIHKEQIPTDMNESDSKKKLPESLTAGIWHCALCKLQFANQNHLLDHIKGSDHQKKLNIKMLNKTNTPKGQSDGIQKEQMKTMPKVANTPPQVNGTTKSIFKQNIQVTARPPVFYAEPYTPLTLNKSASLPIPMPIPDVTVASTQSKKVATNGSGCIAPWYGGVNGLKGTNNLKLSQSGNVAKLNETSNGNKMVAAQTQTDLKKEPKPQIHRLQARPINVQCIDCQIMFSNLDKLLSHPCHPAPRKKPQILHLVESNPIQPEPEQQQPPSPTVAEVAKNLKSNTNEVFVCEDCNLNFEEMHIFESHLLTPRHLFSARRRTTGSINLPSDIQVDVKKPPMQPRTMQIKIPSDFPRKSVNENEMNFVKKDSLSKYKTPVVEISSNEKEEGLSKDDFESIVVRPLAPEKKKTWNPSSLKTVESNANDSGDYKGNSGATPYMEVVQPIPELPVKSSLSGNISENSVSSEMRELMQANNITIRREFLFCNDCCLYLHFDELNKHINSKDHKTTVKEMAADRPPSSVSSQSGADIYPHEDLKAKTGGKSSNFAHMPNLPQFAQFHSVVKNDNYTATGVPASQLKASENFYYHSSPEMYS